MHEMAAQFIKYRECMKWLHNSQSHFGAVTVSLICFHKYNMGGGLHPYFFFRTKHSKDKQSRPFGFMHRKMTFATKDFILPRL